MKSTEIIEKEVLEEMASIGEMEIGSDDHKKAVDTVTKLTDRMIDLKKIELEEKKIGMEKEEVIPMLK